ncbi:MAG: nucleotide disphospho-sugar-binding domain-containing protein [Pseudomonadota bacterium]
MVFAAPEVSQPHIAAVGFDAHQIAAPRLGALTGYLPAPKRRSLAERALRAAQAAGHILNDGFDTVLADVRPDLVILDCEHHSAIQRSIIARHAILLLSFIYQTAPGPRRPPLNSAILPGRGIAGSALGVRAAWAALAFRKRVALARAGWAHWGADLAAAHRALAKRLSLDLGAITTPAGFQMPWSYRLPTLFVLSDKADLPGPLAPFQSHAGPMILRTRVAAAQDPQVQAFLADVPGTRRVYVAFGSIRKPPAPFITALMEVARRNPDLRFLVGGMDADAPKPDTVTCVPWAPQLAALDVADAAIFHGGAGTLNECLVTSTPMLIYPNALDGKGNGARVVHHGLGTVGGYSDDADRIEADLKAVLGSETIRANMKAHQAHAQQMVDDRLAEQAVERALTP